VNLKTNQQEVAY